MEKLANETYEEYVSRVVCQNMADSTVRAIVSREWRLGDKAHRSSKAAQAMENWAVSIHPTVYNCGRMN